MRTEQRDKFDEFVRQMYDELLTNEPKGDFTSLTVEVGLKEVDDHLAKLRAALIVACGAKALDGHVVHSMPPVGRDSQW